MKKAHNNYLFRTIMILITAGLITFAFIHSSMPSSQSSLESAATMGILQSILDAFKIDFALTDHFVRKLAHFVEYTAIGIMLTNTAYSFNKSRPHKFCPHIFFAGLLTAVIDETIQINAPGRAAMVIDVWLDFSGIITGVVLMLIILKIYNLIRR